MGHGLIGARDSGTVGAELPMVLSKGWMGIFIEKCITCLCGWPVVRGSIIER